MPLVRRLHRRFLIGSMGTLIAFHAMAVLAADQKNPTSSPQAKAGKALATRPATASTLAREQDAARVLIAQTLDRKTDLHLDNVPIEKAIRQLSKNTGIPIKIAKGTLSLLPYGSKTELSATIQRRPLRESLYALLRPLGLKFRCTHECVVIEPTRSLRRIARRATWDELATLEKLHSKKWSKELANSLRFQFRDSPAHDAEENRKILYRLAASVGAGPAATVLQQACDLYGWIWHPYGKAVVILSKTRQIEKLLNRRISCHYVKKNLRDVLLDLAARAGVLLHMEPAVLASLPPAKANRFSMKAENLTIRQALEVIVGETGLNYVIESDGIRIVASVLTPVLGSSQANVTAQATVQALRTNAIVGQITLPGEDDLSVAFFIRENDLPPEVNELRKTMIQRVANTIGDILRERELDD